MIHKLFVKTRVCACRDVVILYVLQHAEKQKINKVCKFNVFRVDSCLAISICRTPTCICLFVPTRNLHMQLPSGQLSISDSAQ